MTLEKGRYNWRIFRAATLVAITCSPLFVAVSSYAQATNNEETTMAQTDTPHLHVVPQAPTTEIRPFHVTFPEEQLADLRRRVSSARLYWDTAQISTGGGFFDIRGVKLPVAVSAFPDEIYQAPKSWAEKAYPKLIYYNRLAKGGHFAAWEEPQLFAEELRAAFRSLR